MKAIHLILLATLVTMSIACKQDAGKKIQNEAADAAKIDSEEIILNPESSQSVAELRSHAEALIKKRSENEGVYSMMVVDYWNYKFVFNGTEMSKEGEYDGKWIKFKDDFTYEYGLYDVVQGKGKYHFTLDSSKLIMLDSQSGKKPEEWEVKSKEDVMILVGSNYFGNNPQQCKLERVPSIPKKS